jgi:hypothetical protein
MLLWQPAPSLPRNPWQENEKPRQQLLQAKVQQMLLQQLPSPQTPPFLYNFDTYLAVKLSFRPLLCACQWAGHSKSW